MNVVLIIAASLVLHATTGLAEVACHENETGIVITRAGRHVLTYQKTIQVPEGVDPKYGRSGFIHPISTPSGRVLTDDYPVPHHAHQHGLFFAWKAASFEGKKLNFWEPEKGTTVRHDKVLQVINEEAHAGFRVQLAHLSGERKVLREVWTVTVRADTGHIDFTSEQLCVTQSPLTIEQFHYGGLAIRGSRQWFRDAHTSAGKGALKDDFVEACQLLTDEGLTQADGNHSRPRWVSMSGKVDGTEVSITLIPHPSNDRYPQHVRLHPEMPYFCFIPTVDEPFTIEPGKPWVSRYRMVAADGQAEAITLEAIQNSFAEEGGGLGSE